MGALLALSADPKVVRALEGIAAEAGLSLHLAAHGPLEGEVAAVVLDLDAPGAADLLEQMRDRYPESLIAGHLGLPDRERWLAAERAGCDVVANRGAFATALRRRLQAGSGRGRRHPLMEAADVAGRLGVVWRGAETPVGPLAVYHRSGRLSACADRCPHAGAVVSEGEVSEGVVTCPRHGSQFDVGSGERRRGPADAGLETFPVVSDGGVVYLLVPARPD